MKENKEAIVTNRFILGDGLNGIYSDITIGIKRATATSLKRSENIEIKDEELLSRIESEFHNWIESYKKEGILLDIIILEIGIDNSGRSYAIENSVGGVMHKALAQIGINSPQIFGL